jgi:hypothetical protein
MNVEFNENKPIDYSMPAKVGGVTNFFIKLGLAKDEAGANKVMIVVTIICLALAIYIAF